ncbi:MAG: 1-deoxy-D-xylulose-5-phosphate reductoisomerase [Puniceicoccaceae bacterium]
MEPKRLIILGATGSIGSTTLRVLRAHPERFQLVGIAANANVQGLAQIASEFSCQAVAISNPAPHEPLESAFPNPIEVYHGSDAMVDLVEQTPADLLLVAVVGTAALLPTLAAIRAGVDIALASKEILVLAGHLVTESASRHGVQLLPTDSEHNAIFQCLQGHPSEHLEEIILTASGGPFRELPLSEFSKISLQEALLHPNWSMGPKITVDSATMANKGLEVIEAHWLFNLPPDRIQVVVHPESIVHSMIRFLDGSILAQLSPPSMAFAIQHCLLYPDRAPCPDPSLDFQQFLNLRFSPPDFQKFPCLQLAFESLRTGGLAPAAFNAANEVAVEAFLSEQIHFLDIPKVIETTLEASSQFALTVNLMDLLGVENEIRAIAASFLSSIKA